MKGTWNEEIEKVMAVTVSRYWRYTYAFLGWLYSFVGYGAVSAMLHL